ncbi:hypothetical protein EJ05DRAFT_484509 [Pseudovirgaria hyperparasitica]|uniref:Uncharacterized protein n=1 Tax=Pseudovirgaria hyperparasitica TaxID=470096 RepID=A0A6A6WC00_9PEZI|nr:uncharacterized protein EJ05DRAFT_484509 [Pseudovirgaria hyperparasitica]KAF2759564.1 hypothetical protein EJ05DRAFT_484509 [Pseudovirgaria hyperparasitica]
MFTQAFLVSSLAAFSTAAALPNTLARRGECADRPGAWCSDCVADNSCGNMAVTVAFKPDNLEIGDIDLNKVTDAIAANCYGTGIRQCKPSDYELDTVLENGDKATITINLNSNGYETWAENLMVDAFRAALKGATKKNTVTGEGPAGGSKTVATIPSSVTIAMFDKPEYAIVMGIAVEKDPVEGVCADILGIGSAVAGLAGTPGAVVGAGLSIASVFCD